MTIIWFTLAIVYVFSIIARELAEKKIIDYELNKIVLPNKIFTFLTISVLILISGFRNNIGDTYYYMHTYSSNDFNLQNISLKGDFGFDILQVLLQNISRDPQLLIFTCALITNLLIVIIFRKYSKIFELAIFIYVTSGIYMVTMNGIRQYLAAAIIFFGTYYLIGRNWKKYFLIVLLAGTFHQTALIMIPEYFFVNKKAWKWQTFLLLGISVISILAYEQVSILLFNALENTKYDVYKNFEEGGANIIRILIYTVPLVIAFIGRKKLAMITPYSNVLVNMSILGFIFMLISSQNWIFARIAIYFNLYQVILVSWLVSLFVKKERKIVYFLIIICYLILFYYEQVLTLNIQYKSDVFER